MPKLNEKTAHFVHIVNTIALWGGAAALAIYFIQGGIAFGTERQKIAHVETQIDGLKADMRTNMLDLWGALDEHISSDGHTEVLRIIAANEERDKAIKESLEEIKEDLKTLIRERRNGN